MINRTTVGCCALCALAGCGTHTPSSTELAGGGAANAAGRASTSADSGRPGAGSGMADGGSSSGGAAGVTASTGGHATTSGGQAAAGTGGLPHHIGSCDALAPAGTWEEITPSEVSLEADFKTPAGDNFGDHSFVIDPKDAAHVYLGTSAQGIYESKDCGATWKKINTGRNGDKLDSGRQWTFV